MNEKQKHFLLFDEWYDQLMMMSGANCKLVLHAMVEYQMRDVKPPEFPRNIRAVCTMIFAELERRKANIENGKKGGEARIRAILEKSRRENFASSDASGDVSGGA